MTDIAQKMQECREAADRGEDNARYLFSCLSPHLNGEERASLSEYIKRKLSKNG